MPSPRHRNRWLPPALILGCTILYFLSLRQIHRATTTAREQGQGTPPSLSSRRAATATNSPDGNAPLRSSSRATAHPLPAEIQALHDRLAVLWDLEAARPNLDPFADQSPYRQEMTEIESKLASYYGTTGPSGGFAWIERNGENGKPPYIQFDVIHLFGSILATTRPDTWQQYLPRIRDGEEQIPGKQFIQGCISAVARTDMRKAWEQATLYLPEFQGEERQLLAGLSPGDSYQLFDLINSTGHSSLLPEVLDSHDLKDFPRVVGMIQALDDSQSRNRCATAYFKNQGSIPEKIAIIDSGTLDPDLLDHAIAGLVTPDNEQNLTFEMARHVLQIQDPVLREKSIRAIQENLYKKEATDFQALLLEHGLHPAAVISAPSEN